MSKIDTSVKSRRSVQKQKGYEIPRGYEIPKGDLSLVVVESPTKERTLSKFLGKNFIVKSTFGHLRDLPQKKFGVDVKNGYKQQYEVLPRAKKNISALMAQAAKSSKVYLATDFDREGEAIAWHLLQLLKIPEQKVQRITFHEITPEAIRDALKSPRKIDMKLVEAQIARRVLDRIVGYRLSPLLWEKVKRGLSAGRVQSVAVRLICDREEEIEKFKPQEYWTIQVKLENTKDAVRIPFLSHLVEWEEKKLEKLSLSSQVQAKEISEHLKSSTYHVKSILFKERKRSPPPPFMTSTLTQSASRRYGFSAKKTMMTAQSLYEGVAIDKSVTGLITYMRTDSLHVAAPAQSEARDFIYQKFGKSALPEKPRFYKTKSKTAQEAHEAIRPTSAWREPEKIKGYLSPEQYKIYELIWKRFLASQMTDALYDTVTVEIQSEPKKSLLRAVGSTLKASGFLALYEEEETEEAKEKPEEEKENKIPVLSQGEVLKFLEVLPVQHFTTPPPRYNEASLIKALEQNGIGRPSTYAPIVDTILSRNYVRLQEKQFVPTELGGVVNEQLKKHFPKIVDTNFTAKIEEKLDRIAENELRWQTVIDEFYQPFDKDLKLAKKEMKKSLILPKDSGEICPNCKGKLLQRESRFGKYLCCENFPKCNYKLSLDPEGKKIFPQLLNEKCAKCGKPMVVKLGRRGRFLACTGYPHCKNIIGLDKEGNKVFRPEPKPTDKKCAKCGKMMLLRIGRRGPFLACSGYPACRNIQKVPESLKTQ